MYFVISFFFQNQKCINVNKNSKIAERMKMFMRYRYWSFLGSRSKFVWLQSCQFKSPDSQRISWFCYCFRNNAEILKFLPQKKLNLKCCFLSVLYVGFETRVSKFACFKRFNPKFFSTKQSGAQKSVIYWKIA